MPSTNDRNKRLLPSMVLVLTALAVVMATTAWLSVRSGERDQLLRDHLESQQVVAETGAAGVAAILDGFASDLDRLSRLPSVRYLEPSDRLVRTLDSFLERTAVPTRALIRVDTAGHALFVYPEDGLTENALHVLQESGYLTRAGTSKERLLSPTVRAPGEANLIAVSDLIQPDERPAMGAIIAVFPTSFLASPVERGGQLEEHRVVLRDDRGNVLHGSGGGGLDAVVDGAEEPGDRFVARAPVPSEVEPRIGLELWSTREHALAPLRESFPGWLFLLLLTNGLIAIAGGFLARELWLRRRLDESLERRGELERRLHQAQKMESLGRLAGGIAHDFNNALTAIQGSARLLEEKLDRDEPAREEASAILQASAHVAELTRQLLAFSRRQTLQPRVIDLNGAVRRMELMLRRTLPEDVEVSIEAPPRSSWIRIDPTHLEQVILNLAANARDAMPEGGKLRISTAGAVAEEEADGDGSEPGKTARLIISDNGAGIPPDALPHVFEPFFTTKAAGDGIGLGLATVYGIVKQSGGQIRVESEAGEGTRFVLDFPLAEAPEPEDLTGSQEVVVSRSAPAPGPGATILLVEDNAAVRRVAERALARHGHRIITAGSGEEALRILSDPTVRIDLLLTDVVMPGMNGRELADRIRVTHPGTAILFMSGYMEDEVLQRGIAAADTRFLEKPFTADALARSVESALAESPHGSPGVS